MKKKRLNEAMFGWGDGTAPILESVGKGPIMNDPQFGNGEGRMAYDVAMRHILCDEWVGLYRQGWKGIITEASFAHPAKFARGLIEKIYDHLIDERWVSRCVQDGTGLFQTPDKIVDPFGGVALGAFYALQLGLDWTGCELELKFVGLGNENIDLWNRKYSNLPGWGIARLIQGDSRRLVEILANGVDCAVSSPPYVDSMNSEKQGIDFTKAKPDYPGRVMHKERQVRMKKNHDNRLYGDTPGQLGGMSEGSFDAVVSSPPYNENKNNQIHDGEPAARGGDAKQMVKKDYVMPETEGSLGAMKMDGFDAAISSPPFQGVEGSVSGKKFKDPDKYAADLAKGYKSGKIKGHPASEKVIRDQFERENDYTYGDSEGQLHGMKPGNFDAAVSSPPYADGCANTGGADKGVEHVKGNKKSVYGVKRRNGDLENSYGQTDGQAGAMAGDDFWSAARIILEQTYQVLRPGAHAVFVVKNFVRAKKIVDFTGQWIQLCEAVGFRLLHHHHALLKEAGKKQPAMDGFDVEGDTWRLMTRDMDTSVERKSFFRRLAEKKGSPRIDWESVLCFVRE